MSIQDRITLKDFFKTGKYFGQSELADLIDSFISIQDDNYGESFAADFGSNSDGEWVKLPDGTMICMRSGSIDDTTNGFTTSGNLTYTVDVVASGPTPQTFTSEIYRGVWGARTSGTGWSEPVFAYSTDKDYVLNKFKEAAIALGRTPPTGRVWTITQLIIGKWK